MSSFIQDLLEQNARKKTFSKLTRDIVLAVVAVGLLGLAVGLVIGGVL